jgi:hypothetical protein
LISLLLLLCLSSLPLHLLFLPLLCTCTLLASYPGPLRGRRKGLVHTVCASSFWGELHDLRDFPADPTLKWVWSRDAATQICSN